MKIVEVFYQCARKSVIETNVNKTELSFYT